jgi:histidinol-phosphate/aromatic aminotransferase/cobyric acid decarboxylase-like protein
MTTCIAGLDPQFEVSQSQPIPCFHGGAFFDAIGTEFDQIERRHEVINADVLDAWFPPSPDVLRALRADLGWLLRTSPPVSAEGLVKTIARGRGLPCDTILPAAGSSDLIFLALRHWLTPASRVLLVDPAYGEYAHVLERVIGCRVERFSLRREDNYDLNLELLARRIQKGFDLVILVNPNNPTGRFVPRLALESLLNSVPIRARVWIDEAYIDYVGAGESLENFAAASQNVVVCKSMSKVYALSGVRAAYLCAPPKIVAELRPLTPPWAVSLPAQVAAVKALQDPEYYAGRYAQTHRLRAGLERELATFPGWEVVPGCANSVLCHLPSDGQDSAALVRGCRARGLFLRDAGIPGRQLGSRAVRVAVKDAATQQRMIGIIAEVLGQAEFARSSWRRRCSNPRRSASLEVRTNDK